MGPHRRGGRDPDSAYDRSAMPAHPDALSLPPEQGRAAGRTVAAPGPVRAEREAAGRSGTSPVAVGRWAAGEVRADRDWVAAEEPLQVAVDGAPLAVVMRTPGSDLELVLGLLHAEGVVRGRNDVAGVRLSPSGQDELGGQDLDVELLPETEGLVDVRLRRPLAGGVLGWQRRLPSTSACGLCGATTLDALERTQRPVRGRDTWPIGLLHTLPARLRSRQAVFASTGGLHAAALVTGGGDLAAVCEDVGRHNAVDKLVGGALMRDQLPLERFLLLVSGRAGFEIVQKATAAGIPLIAAVSAPTSLAVRASDRLGATLVGFLRDDRCNVYTHPFRVVPGPGPA